MDHGKLGTAGLNVSRLCIGCMTYGDPQRSKDERTLDQEKRQPLLRQAVEAGINFFETAKWSE